MSLHAVNTFYLRCDAVACSATFTDHNPGVTGTRLAARESGWRIGSSLRDLCPEHASA